MVKPSFNLACISRKTLCCISLKSRLNVFVLPSVPTLACEMIEGLLEGPAPRFNLTRKRERYKVCSDLLLQLQRVLNLNLFSKSRGMTSISYLRCRLQPPLLLPGLRTSTHIKPRTYTAHTHIEGGILPALQTCAWFSRF